jgi:hypothetical protein
MGEKIHQPCRTNQQAMKSRLDRHQTPAGELQATIRGGLLCAPSKAGGGNVSSLSRCLSPPWHSDSRLELVVGGFGGTKAGSSRGVKISIGVAIAPFLQRPSCKGSPTSRGLSQSVHAKSKKTVRTCQIPPQSNCSAKIRTTWRVLRHL